ncbi:MAG: polysaccharide deacetylase family protein [Syntrophomonadales bacterium]|jgi:peptidoglycan/xylan/chitin deacetylase (PgdA/CDA1 family)
MSITTVRKVATTERLVALTFDDGPHPVFTPRALDIMASYDSRGTWFVLGSLAKNHPDLIPRIASEGHEVGAHSYDHVDLTRLSRNQVYSQLSRTKELIVNQAGMFWPYFRPTFMAYNDMVLSVADMLGFLYNVLWSVDPRDYNSSANQIISRVLSAVTPGSIVILHEVTSSTTTALPTILRGLKEMGYSVVTISELLKAVPVE